MCHHFCLLWPVIPRPQGAVVIVEALVGGPRMVLTAGGPGGKARTGQKVKNGVMKKVSIG